VTLIRSPGQAKAAAVTFALHAHFTSGAYGAYVSSGAYGAYVSAVTELLTRPCDVTIYAVSATVHPIADLSTEPQRAS
jgi:hypothetical protein